MNIEEQGRIDAVNRYFSNVEIPSVSTIKRIVKRHNLKVNKRERYKRVKSKKRYTILKETFTSLENIRARSLHFVGQHNDLSAWKKRDKELKNISADE